MNFREFEISDFKGIVTSRNKLAKNELAECINFDNRFVKGDLTIRAGYSIVYSPPNNADHRNRLSGISWLSFENFYISDRDGIEVTTWVGKATLNPEPSYTDPGVNEPTPINIGVFFSSHQLIADTWVTKNWDKTTTGKYWLNHNILTKIADIGTHYYDLILDFGDSTIVNKKLNGWTIYNITRNETLQIIDTYNAGSNQVGIFITAESHMWDIGDTVLISNNFIPYNYLTEYYNVTKKEITFHKVLDDLRIGFGGKPNRIGLSIGYRKRSIMLGAFTWGDPSFNDNLETIASVNNIIITTYLPVLNDNEYWIDINVEPDGDIPPNDYYFRFSSKLDGFNELLFLQKKYKIEHNSFLTVTPYIKSGMINKLITELNLYVATTKEDNPYFFIKNLPLTKENYEEGYWTINDEGFIYPTLANSDELHTDHNAAINSVTDYNTLHGTANNGFERANAKCTLSIVTGSDAKLGNYAIKSTATATGKWGIGMALTQPGLFKKDITYTISFYARTAIDKRIITLEIPIAGMPAIHVESSDTFGTNPYVIEYKPIKDADTILFYSNYDNIGEYLIIDAVSIKRKGLGVITNSIIDSASLEMSKVFGYLPTYDMVKSWDNALVSQGRTFYINPYIDKRYENKIFRSHISGAGAFMYDIASAQENIDIENFDGNKFVGLTLLSNLQFIAFKTNGTQRVDPNSGASRSISIADGCVSRDSIRNMGDVINYCGETDIYTTDGSNTISIAEGTIREDYRSIENKTNIIATREERGFAYRFFTGNTNSKVEYILTKEGWIKRIANKYPEKYVLAKNGINWFMNAGTIYADDDNVLDAGVSIATPYIRTAEIDAEMMGEDLTERDSIFIRSIWLYYTYNKDIIIPNDGIKGIFAIYGDSSLMASEEITLASGKNKLFIKLPIKPAVRKFYLTLTLEALPTAHIYGRRVSIHSLGVMFKPIKVGYFN